MRYDRPTLVRVGLCLLLAVITVPGIGYVCYQVYTWLYSAALITEVDKRITTENEVFRTLTQMLGALFFLITAVFTWRTVRATEQSAKTARDNYDLAASVAQRNHQLAEEGQTTERFTRAIELIGDPQIEVRLGGVFALLRIAKHVTTEREAIKEILAAYVREKCTIPSGEDGPDALAPDRTSADVQAIINGITNGATPMCDPGQKVDFSRADLRRALFENAELTGADFRSCWLDYAHLHGVKLQGAQLELAYLRFVGLNGAHLEHAHLDDAHLDGANLAGAHLDDTDLIGVDLRKVRGLTHEQLAAAKRYEHDLLPDYLKQSNQP